MVSGDTFLSKFQIYLLPRSFDIDIAGVTIIFGTRSCSKATNTFALTSLREKRFHGKERVLLH
jgi:hypothetical protein